ncbi:unnamed protein product, partial [Iphiclides podalirius]
MADLFLVLHWYPKKNHKGSNWGKGLTGGAEVGRYPEPFTRSFGRPDTPWTTSNANVETAWHSRGIGRVTQPRQAKVTLESNFRKRLRTSDGVDEPLCVSLRNP